MIEIKITADSAEDARKEMLVLIGGAVTVSKAEGILKQLTEDGIIVVPVEPETIEPAPVEPPKTRTRAPKEKAVEPKPISTIQYDDPDRNPEMFNVPPAGDPLLANPAAEVKTGDPLAQLPVATSSDPLAGTQASAAAETGVLTLEMIRHKVAKAALNNNKQAVKDLIKTYTTADGKPCEITTEIPEKDWADYYAQLDLIGL